MPEKREGNLHAVNYLVNKIKEEPYQITIIATGPLTNIGLAILMDEEFLDNVKKIVSMRGAFNVTSSGYGNDTPVAEFNIYTDPEAAKIVYECGAEVYAVGLDVTMKTDATISREERVRIKEEGGKLFFEMTRRSSQYINYLGLHDPMALSAVIDKDILKFQKYKVDVELNGIVSGGQTIADRREWLPEFLKEEPNIHIAVDVDGEKFLKLMWDRVFRV